MKKMKTVSAVLAMLMVFALLVGCSSGKNEKSAASQQPAASEQPKATEQEKLKIGVSIQGFKGLFTNYIVAGIKDYANELGNVELIVVDAEDRADKQISQVENFIIQGVHAIILNPVDISASSAAVDTAVKAKIPIITVNTQTENQDKATAFVGSDDIVAGEIQMQYIADELGGKGNVVILHGAMGHSAQIGRRIGAMNVIDKHPDMQLVFEQTAEWQTDKAMAIVENWLTTGMKIDAIAANNDTMAQGAQAAVDAAGKSDEIMVMGMDALPEVLDAIKNGKMKGTIWQDGIAQGKYSLDLAVKAAKGEQVEDLYIPYELVNINNIEEYFKKAKERDELTEKYRQ